MGRAATRVRQRAAVTALVLVWLLVTGQSGFGWAVARQAHVTGMVTGDVDNDDVVTCRDVALSRNSLGTRRGEELPSRRADVNKDGWIGRGDVEAISRLLPAGSGCERATNYLIVLGHDGSPDPDDNLAQLAGFMAVKRGSQRHQRVAFGGLVFGDTTSDRKVRMISGADPASKANWIFHRSFNVPALTELGLTPSTHADVVTEKWDFDPADPWDLTSGGRLLFGYIRAAIDAGDGDRVVYTAGGGQHVPGEAIALLRNHGYSDSQILEHFAVVQHSRMNWTTYTEAPARRMTLDFTIRIDDQNGNPASGPGFRPRSGSGFPPKNVSPAATSRTFAKAWSAAAVGGSEVSGIPNHRARKDASDSGAASFASTPALMDRFWYRRGVGLSLMISPNLSSACDSPANQDDCIVYDDYSTLEMNANMNNPWRWGDNPDGRAASDIGRRHRGRYRFD